MFLLRCPIQALVLSLLLCLVHGGELLCPYEGCKCVDAYVLCKGVTLTNVRLRTGANVQPVTHVTLFDNQIHEVTKDILPSGLAVLTINRNPIRHIDPAAFNGSASTLEYLEISDAVFTELPDALLMLDNLISFTSFNMQITKWGVTILSHLGHTLQGLNLEQVDLRKWPESFKCLTVLKSLHIRTSLITDIPEDAFMNMSDSLQYLRLEKSNLRQVPKALLQLRKLSILYLTSNSIEYLENIPEVTYLDLNHNLLSDADNVVQALQASVNSLEHLSLTYNQLTSIPNFSNFAVLEHLSLNHNAIMADLNQISDFTSKLNILSLSNNQLTFIPNISCFPFLTKLSLDNNIIISNSTSDSQISAKSLEILILSNNRLTSLYNLPRSPVLKVLELDNNEISDLMFESYLSDSLQVSRNSLSSLTLSYNQLTTIPYLSNLSVLNYLQLDFNNIVDSASGSLPSSLQVLNLHKNRLYSIPSVIVGLSQLFTLILSSNRIYEFNLTNIPSQLNTLDLSFNHITRLHNNTFPENCQLRVLDLSFNFITRLDGNIFPENCSLQTLYLQSNPLVYIADSAFDNVKVLMILDLSWIFLMNLPLSLSSLSQLNILSMENIPTLVCPCPMPKKLIQWLRILPPFYQIRGNCGNRKATIKFALMEENFQCQTTTVQKTTPKINRGVIFMIDLQSIIVCLLLYNISQLPVWDN